MPFPRIYPFRHHGELVLLCVVLTLWYPCGATESTGAAVRECFRSPVGLTRTCRAELSWSTHSRTPFRSSSNPFSAATFPDILFYGLAWEYNALNSFLAAPIVGPDGNIYVGNSNGALLAFARNGTLLWEFPTGLTVHSTPSTNFLGTMVYFSSWDASLYAVSDKGELVWSRSFSILIDYESPLVLRVPAGMALPKGEELVLTGAHDGLIHAMRADNGAPVWQATVGTFVSTSYISQTTDEKGVIVANTRGFLTRLTLDTGAEEWRVAIPNTTFLYSFPTVTPSGIVGIGGGSESYTAFNESTGNIIYTNRTLPGHVYSTLAYRDGAFYTAVDSGYVVKTDAANGTVLWTTAIGEDIYERVGPVILPDESLFIGTIKGHVVRIHTGDGSILDKFYIGGVIAGSPALGVDGTVFVGSSNGRFAALSGTLWPRSAGDVARTSQAKVLPYPYSSLPFAPMWNAPTGDSSFTHLVVAPGELAIYGTGDGVGPGILRAVDTRSGATRWEYVTDNAIGGVAVGLLPGLNSTTVAVCGTFDASIYAIYANNGSLVWRTNIGQKGQFFSAPTILDDRVYISFSATFNSTLIALDVRTGTVVWNVTLGDGDGSEPAISQNGIAVVTTESGGIYAVNRTTGDMLWSQVNSTRPLCAPAISERHNVTFTADNEGNAMAVALDTGVISWIVSLGTHRVRSPAVVDDLGLVIFPTEKANVVALSISNGSVVWTSEELLPASVSPVITPPTVIRGAFAVVGLQRAARSGLIIALDIQTGRVLSKSWVSGPVNGPVAVTPDGRMFATRADSVISGLGYCVAGYTVATTTTTRSATILSAPNPPMSLQSRKRALAAALERLERAKRQHGAFTDGCNMSALAVEGARVDRYEHASTLSSSAGLVGAIADRGPVSFGCTPCPVGRKRLQEMECSICNEGFCPVGSAVPLNVTPVTLQGLNTSDLSSLSGIATKTNLESSLPVDAVTGGYQWWMTVLFVVWIVSVMFLAILSALYAVRIASMPQFFQDAHPPEELNVGGKEIEVIHVRKSVLGGYFSAIFIVSCVLLLVGVVLWYSRANDQVISAVVNQQLLEQNGVELVLYTTELYITFWTSARAENGPGCTGISVQQDAFEVTDGGAQSVTVEQVGVGVYGGNDTVTVADGVTVPAAETVPLLCRARIACQRCRLRPLSLKRCVQVQHSFGYSPHDFRVNAQEGEGFPDVSRATAAMGSGVSVYEWEIFVYDGDGELRESLQGSMYGVDGFLGRVATVGLSAQQEAVIDETADTIKTGLGIGFLFAASSSPTELLPASGLSTSAPCFDVDSSFDAALSFRIREDAPLLTIVSRRESLSAAFAFWVSVCTTLLTLLALTMEWWERKHAVAASRESRIEGTPPSVFELESMDSSARLASVYNH